EAELELAPLLELARTIVRHREEEIADLEKERRAEGFEEADRLLREPDLRRRRELLADAAHRLRRRAACDLADVGEHDVARAEVCEVVCDRRSDCAGAGYDNPSSH